MTYTQRASTCFFYFLLQSLGSLTTSSLLFRVCVCVCVWKEIKTFLQLGQKKKKKISFGDVEQKGIKTFQQCGPWDFMPPMAEELDESGER
jgi:hypothetical protein